MAGKRVAVGQAGGPTTVANASLFGFLEKALPHCELYGVINGIEGLAEAMLVPLTNETVKRHRHVREMPGAWLGAGRWPAREEDFEAYAESLRRRDIGGLALIGGNGTMWSCMQLERAARSIGYELAVVGIPKTVDNDLAGTDHSPGFASAARFVTTVVRDVGKDLESMRNFEAVRVLETMGRNVGWLAMSAAYLKNHREDPPHLIYAPENGFSESTFLEDVQQAYQAHGYAVAVVGEGLLDRARREGDENVKSPLLGGVSRELAALVQENLGLSSRGELLGMAQRSYSLAVSRRDREEATLLGAEAAQLLEEGESGVMIALERRPASLYEVEVRHVPLTQVAGVERPLPEEWRATSGGTAPESFVEWLRPLVGEELFSYPQNLLPESTLLSEEP